MTISKLWHVLYSALLSIIQWSKAAFFNINPDPESENTTFHKGHWPLQHTTHITIHCSHTSGFIDSLFIFQGLLGISL